MLPWAFFILVLDIILVFQLFQCSCFTTTNAIVLAGIAIACVGIVIRTVVKTKARTREKMTQELRQLRNENKALLERIADIREKEIIDLTNDDSI